MKDKLENTEKTRFLDERIIILNILAFFIILFFIIKNQVEYSILVHSVYSTFLIAMGLIVYNITNLNNNKASENIGIIFFLAGTLEAVYIFILIYGLDKFKNISVVVSETTDIFLIVSIYLVFKLIKRKPNVFIISLVVLVGVFTSVSLTVVFASNTGGSVWNILGGNVDFFVSLVTIVVSLCIYKKINTISDNLDYREKYIFRKILIVTIISRFPGLFDFIIGNAYFESVTRQIINNINIYYLYQYIIHTNVRKTYQILNETNTELIIRTESLKERNKRLREETDKIGELKEILTIKEQKLQSTLNASVNSIVVFDEKSKVAYVNKAFMIYFGYNELDKDYKIDEDLRLKIKNYSDLLTNIDTVFETKKNSNEFIYGIDGRIFQATFSPLITKEEIQGVLCILIDKTKKKEFEQKIIEANQRYESFLESIGDGIVVLEGKKMIYANKACKDIFKNDIDNIDFSEDCDKDNLEREYIVDGEKIYVEKRLSRYTKNDKDKTIIVIRNITSRKIAQMKLKESQKSYSRFIDIIPDGICLIDKDLNIYYANKSLLDMLKIKDLNDIKNTNVKNIMSLTVEEKEIFEENMSSVLEENKYKYLLEHEFIVEKDESVQVEVNALPFSIENNKYIMLITKDLTYKKTSEKAEQELLERLKTDKVKTEFFANMSHELKTPLNVISSSNQLVDSFYKSGKIEDFNNNVKSHIELVRQSSYRLQRLINNIIDLTKMESGFYTLKLDKHNIVEVIEDLFGYVNDYARKKNIDLIFDTEFEEIYVYIDKQEFERIILNLLSNCIKFTKNGGNIYVNIYTKNQQAFISVKDNGVGIPKNKLKLVFEEFAQVDKTLSRNTEGSGIGLTIVKNLVELHGGNIEVISQVNKGTEFIISIPIKNLSYEECQKNKGIYNIEEKVKIEFSDIYY